jgi:hypothetical protein
MSTFEFQAVHGYVALTKVEAIPDKAIPLTPHTPGPWIIVCSNTGQYHSIDTQSATLYRLPGEPLLRFLDVRAVTRMKHLPGMHDDLIIQPGAYLIDPQRSASHR